jgi:glycosyltransferase involved in cell wall biosynthesis
MSQILISACIIARDEERVLERCLSSIEGVCDEVCLVDTGSRDRTQVIARAFGARVVRFTACNDSRGLIRDFALARNRSLAMARGEWILWIDADEVLRPRSGPAVQRVARGKEYDAVSVQLVNGGARWMVVRMFRRAPDVRFAGVVHEWPTLRGRVHVEPRIVICNLPDKTGKETSAQRDLRLCGRALASNPKDTRMRLYFARALEKTNALDKAIPEYQRYARASGRFRAGRHYARHRIAVCHLLMSRWREALTGARAALAIDAARAESHCVAGDAHLALGQLEQAVAAYRAAIACPPVPAGYPMFSSAEYYSRYPRAQLVRLGAR